LADHAKKRGQRGKQDDSAGIAGHEAPFLFPRAITLKPLGEFVMTEKPAPETPATPAPPPAKAPPAKPKEIGGPKGPEPTRFGDWEQKGRVSDF
jgi:hypothetical protein